MKKMIMFLGLCLLALPFWVGMDQFTSSFQLSTLLVLGSYLLQIISQRTSMSERKELGVTYSLVCLLLAGFFTALAPFDGQIRLSKTKELFCLLTGISVSGIAGYRLFFAAPVKENMAINQKGQHK